MATAQIYADLKRDHDKQREMLKQLAELKGDSAKRQKLFEAFRLEVQSHAAAEEESLYATMLGDPELRDDARHSVSEHKEVDDLLGELMDLDFASDEWESKFYHMRHRYEHHIDEEEEEMFPAAEKELDDATEEKLAEIYEDRKPKELEEAKANPPGGDDRE
ncbi:hemerythrin domain-containing protein [Sphingomonas sp.]|uniref:hemerythrin domain-containing protein n=1 Tax=Sphingomonas sp. TaxID=28214 RepID=UPI0035B17726